jgi:hypothetical protein
MAIRIIELAPHLFTQCVEIARKMGADKITLSCGDSSFHSNWLMQIEGDRIPEGANPTVFIINYAQHDDGFSEVYSIGHGLEHIGGAN